MRGSPRLWRERIIPYRIRGSADPPGRGDERPQEECNETLLQRLLRNVTELHWVRNAFNDASYLTAGMIEELEHQKKMWVRGQVAFQLRRVADKREGRDRSDLRGRFITR